MIAVPVHSATAAAVAAVASRNVAYKVCFAAPGGRFFSVSRCRILSLKVRLICKHFCDITLGPPVGKAFNLSPLRINVAPQSSRLFIFRQCSSEGFLKALALYDSEAPGARSQESSRYGDILNSTLAFVVAAVALLLSRVLVNVSKGEPSGALLRAKRVQIN